MDNSYKFLFVSLFVVRSYWIQEIFMSVDADLNCSPALDLRPLWALFYFVPQDSNSEAGSTTPASASDFIKI